MLSSKDEYSDIVKFVRTKQEADRCIEQIDTFLEAFYEVGKDPDLVLKQIFPSTMATALLEQMQKIGVTLQNQEGCKAYLLHFRELLQKASLFTITLSFEPDDALVGSICTYVRETFSNPYCLLDIKIDPALIGGAEIIWQGRYWNLSLEKQIDEWFDKRSTTSIKSTTGSTGN